jgi:amino acid permease
MKKNKIIGYIIATAILSGTILGVGIFGVPNVFFESGFSIGIVFLVITLIFNILSHLIYGETLLRTPGNVRAPGLARIYLGKIGYIISSIASFVGVSGVLLAYLILGSQFLQNFFNFLGLNLGETMITIIFWLVGIIGMTLGIKFIGMSEIVGLVLIVLLIFVFFIFGFPQLNSEQLLKFDFSKFLLPYGVLLFALSGGSAIPEIIDYFRKKSYIKEKINFKLPIIIGTTIPAILYIFFVLGIFGIFPDKFIPVNIIPSLLEKNILLGITTNILGMILIITSFFITGLNFKNTLICDFKIKKILSWLITASLPIILYFSGIRSFIGVIGFLGAVVLAIQTIINIMVYHLSQKKGKLEPVFSLKFPLWAKISFVILLLIGAVWEIIGFF